MEQLTFSAMSEIKEASQIMCSDDGKYVLFNVSSSDMNANKKYLSLHLYNTHSGKTKKLIDNKKVSSCFWIDNDVLCIPAEKKGAENQSAFFALNVVTDEKRDFFTIPEKINSCWNIGESRFLVRAIKDYNPPGEGESEFWVTHNEYPFKQNGGGYVSGKRNTLFIFKEGKLCPITDKATHSSGLIISSDKSMVWHWGDTYEGYSHADQELYALNVSTGKNEKIRERDECIYNGGAYLGGRVYIIKNYMRMGHDLHNNELWSFLPDGTDWKKELVLSSAFSRFGMKSFDGRIYYIDPERSKSILKSWIPGNEPQIVYSGAVSVDEFNISSAGIFFIGRSSVAPAEMYTLKDGELICISGLNEGFAEKYGVNPPEFHSFIDMDGFVIDGWCQKPINCQPGKKYPGVLRIHGGPSGFFDEFYNIKTLFFAANGYFVFYANPRGSGTYGREHMYLGGQHGTYDFKDLMMFTDEMVKKYPGMDGDKLCVTGGSYGGFLTNWIVSHTNRFKAAVSLVSTTNWISKLFTCDNAHGKWLLHEADPWNDPERLWWQSPLKYANRVNTPVLFIQNQDDYRAPPGEAEQMFTALCRFKIPTKMIVNFNAHHGGMNPIQQKNLYEQSLIWFNTYTETK